MSPGSSLQSRPALPVAIGQLAGIEQTHLQISLRVLSSKLKVPCITVSEETATITLHPVDGDDKHLCVSSLHGDILVERPVRLMPLQEALAETIDRILAAEAGHLAPGMVVDAAAARVTAEASQNRTEAMPAGEVQAGSQRVPSLLALLLERKQPGPLRVVLKSGHSLLLDARYHSAYLEGGLTSSMLADDAVAQIDRLAPDEFDRASLGLALDQRVSVEQICWLLQETADTRHLLSRWHDQPAQTVQLDTWPNLSMQSDALAWLGVLTKMSRRSLPLSDVVRLAVDAGIPLVRVRHGLSLLLTFRHAQLLTPVINAMPAHRPAPTPPPTAAPALPQQSGGLLSRIRSRLRALVS